jgi:hypothetical protein
MVDRRQFRDPQCGSVSQTFDRAAIIKDDLLTQMAGGEDFGRLEAVFAQD